MRWTSSLTRTSWAAVLCAQWFGGGFGATTCVGVGVDRTGGAATTVEGAVLVLDPVAPVSVRGVAADAQAVSRAAARAAAPSIAFFIPTHLSRATRAGGCQRHGAGWA